jgi:hypothetical protein
MHWPVRSSTPRASFNHFFKVQSSCALRLYRSAVCLSILARTLARERGTHDARAGTLYFFKYLQYCHVVSDFCCDGSIRFQIDFLLSLYLRRDGSV